MEITRGPGYFGPGQVRVWHEPWDCPEGVPTERTYVPDWPEHADLAHMLDSIAQTRSLLAATMRPPLGFARWSDGWADRYLQMLSEAHW